MQELTAVLQSGADRLAEPEARLPDKLALQPPFLYCVVASKAGNGPELGRRKLGSGRGAGSNDLAWINDDTAHLLCLCLPAGAGGGVRVRRRQADRAGGAAFRQHGSGWQSFHCMFRCMLTGAGGTSKEMRTGWQSWRRSSQQNTIQITFDVFHTPCRSWRRRKNQAPTGWQSWKRGCRRQRQPGRRPRPRWRCAVIVSHLTCPSRSVCCS